MTSGIGVSTATTGGGDDSSPTGSAASYHNDMAARRSRRSSSQRRSSLMEIMRRAFSIDDYMQAQSDEELDFADDEEDGIDHERGQPLEASHLRMRFLGLAIVVLLIAASIAVTAKTRRRHWAEPNETEMLVCSDPIQALKESAVVEGAESAAVAADHPLCSQMGLAILRDKGGNAVDAAVTVALCLGVANPASSGMGGGAFMLVHAPPVDESKEFPDFIDARKGEPPIAQSGKVTEVIDCREVAPAAAYTEMYLDAPKMASVFGGLAIGVPGELKGLELAHARHGSLPWSDVVEPVMRLALRGVEINANLAHEIQLMTKYLNNSLPDFGLRAILTRGDSWNRPLREKERLQNPKLAELLGEVMRDGSNALYTGKRAELLAQEIQDAGGIVTKEDLESYKATLRTPVYAHDVSGFSIVGVGPPSSGGAAIIGAARMLSGYLTPLATFADTLSSHRLAEACRHVFSIRMSLCDPAYNSDVVEDAVKDLTTGPYMEGLRQATLDNATLPVSQYGGSKWAQLDDSDGGANASDAQEGDRVRRQRELYRRFGNLEDSGTSHFSIVDKDGNAVTMTTSVNTYFGSNVLSQSSGIVLSNTMDDFSNPGKPNYFGLKPSESNFIKPGKKPLSSMAPTMVFHRTASSETEDGTELGRLVLAIGASGGPKIITAVLQVFLNKMIIGKSLFESIIYPRLHDQLIYHDAALTTTEKSELLQGTEISVSQRTKDALTRRGHGLLDIDYAGTVQAIFVDQETGHLTAACDVRKGGSPAAY